MEFNDHNMTKFCNEFALHVVKNHAARTEVVDPDGIIYDVSESFIKWKAPKKGRVVEYVIDPETNEKVESSIRHPHLLSCDISLLPHVLKSITEFADWWQKKNITLELNSQTYAHKPSSDKTLLVIRWE